MACVIVSLRFPLHLVGLNIERSNGRVTWGKTTPSCMKFEATERVEITHKVYISSTGEYTKSCYERRAPGNIRKLNFAILDIYTCFYAIFSHYTCHSSLNISDNKERHISRYHMITILIMMIV